MDKKIRKVLSATTKALEDTRSLIVTISTPTPDRSGDVVVPKGAKLEHFLKNPVVLFGHKYDEPPIAKAEDLIVTDDGIRAKVTFPAEGVYKFADAIYGLYKAGIMNAWSIGFQSDRQSTESLSGGGLKFNSWELLEFSAVPVPANAEALTIMRSKGLEDKEIEELTQQKDVAEVISLAYLIDDLNWLIEAFKRNEVNEDVTTQMGEALTILMQVLKKEAVLGKKEFMHAKAEPIEKSKDDEPTTVEVGIKNVAIDVTEKQTTITYTVDGQEKSVTHPLSDEELAQLTPDEEPVDPTIALKALRDALKPADKEIGLVLRNLKSLLAKPKQEGGDN